jgi:hypothetical protein
MNWNSGGAVCQDRMVFGDQVEGVNPETVALVQRRHVDLLRVNSALCRMTSIGAVRCH